MKRRRAGFVPLIVAALIAAGAVAVPAPPVGADPCPDPVSGGWTGTAESGFATFDLDISFDFETEGSLTGTVSIDSGTPSPLAGTVDCGVITFGTVSSSITFDGTIALDGRSATGTFDAGITGTWTATADPYVLTATSTVQPTTIAPLAASSWGIDVQNSGGAAATLVTATFGVSGAGEIGDLRDASVSQGTGCSRDTEFPDTIVHCDLGTILAGGTASAGVTVVSTGGAGTSIAATGAASSQVGGGTDDTAPPATISVVAPASLPPTTASGVAQPGVSFNLGTKATPETPVVVKFKLPKKVAAGTTAPARSRSTTKRRRTVSITDAQLMVARRRLPGRGGASASGTALGLPKLATVLGPSVPMSISRTSTEAGSFCGGSACSGELIHITSFSGYNDRKRPAKVTITWDASVQGRGVSSAIYKRGDARTSPTSTLPLCFKTKLGYTNLPCVSKRKLVGGGDVQFRILLLSGDPKFGRR